MVGALNKLPIAIFGMMIFHDPVTSGGILGILIAFIAGCLYSYAKTRGNTSSYHSLNTNNNSNQIPSMVKMNSIRDEELERLEIGGKEKH